MVMHDLEKAVSRGSKRALDRSPTSSPDAHADAENDDEKKRRGRHRAYITQVIDGFRRDPSSCLTTPGTIGADGHVFDVTLAAHNTAVSPLVRQLEGRHLQMIAIGGSIGTGLFVSSGAALAEGGPASLLIAFCMTGIMLYCTVQALGEMAVMYPVAGSFSAYSTRFLDPAWGFAMGWNYALQWLVTLPLEIVAASITIQFWNHGMINSTAWVIIFLVLIISINFFGVRGYGEAEFVFSIVKVIAVISFIILGIILNICGGPDGSYIGGKYWSDPGPFVSGFKGLCSVFITAAFAFSGTEMVGLAAAETANPRRTLPTAIKQVFWRITVFYVVALMLVGLLVPSNDPRLLRASAVSSDATASPFVIAIQNAGIEVLPSVFNVVIMIAVLSVGNASVYGSSRTLAALAEQGQAPKFLGYIDRRGRPLVSICIASALGFLSFFAGSKFQSQAFSWMIAISGLAAIFTWGSICLAHIRFRRAWAVQGHSLTELPYRSQAGIIGSWIGLTLNALVLIAQFWTAFAPVGYERMTTSEIVENWFNYCMSIPLILVFYVPYKLWYRTKFMRAKDMDLITGAREINVAELVADERAAKAQLPAWKRVYSFFC